MGADDSDPAETEEVVDEFRVDRAVEAVEMFGR